MDRLAEKETVPGSIVQEGLEAVVAEQRRRLVVLQSIVDARGRKVAASIMMPTVDYAAAALNTYTQEWFTAQPYSRRVLVLIAQALIDAAKPYAFVDTSTWERIVRTRQ